MQKAFNLAGIQTAAVVIPDATIRHKVNRGLNTDEVAEPGGLNRLKKSIQAYKEQNRNYNSGESYL